MRNIEDYTTKYIQDDFEFIQVEYRRKKVLEIIKERRPSTLLEIGCGMKPLFINLTNVKTTVIDPSEKFCNNAEKLNVKGTNTIINDFFDVNFREKYGNEEFETIVCSSLLHEVEKPMELVDAIYKVCSEDTLVHINVPNANSLHRIIAKEAGIIKEVHDMSSRNEKFQQHSIFDMDTLTRLIEKCGFEIIDKGSYFVKPFTHSQMMEMLNKGIIEKTVLVGLDGLVKYMPEFGSEIYVNCRIR